MGIKDFKKAFQNFDITYYHDKWEQSAVEQNGPGKKWFYPFTTIKEQEIFLTFDSISQRMVPPGCPIDGNLNNTYNLILKDSTGKLVA